MNKHLQKFLWIIGIASGTALLLLLFTGFHNEAFLYDDNRNQWFPIIDKAYEQFFSSGIMPNYDFYQCKGLEIADEGYYSLQNPFMLTAYMIYRFIFFKSWGSTVSFYIWLMLSAGNITAFFLCRLLGLDWKKALLAVMMYASCSAFYMFGYWYYIFNNYFIVPLIFYAILKFRQSKLSYTAVGVILAFSLLLGNVQYTVYHYCLYAVIAVCMGIFSRKNNFLKMLTNCMTGIILTIPQLVLLMQASVRSSTYSTSSSAMQNFIPLHELFLGILIPSRIFGENGSAVLDTLFQNKLLGRSGIMLLYAGGFGICLYGLLGMGMAVCIRKCRSVKNISDDQMKILLKSAFRQTEQKAFYIGILVSILFFILMITGNIVAHIMSALPVLKNLRFMFKGYFIFLPLCLVPAALFLRKITRLHYSRIIHIICILSVLTGLVNNYFVEQDARNAFSMHITARYDDEIASLDDELQKADFQKNSYRVCSFIDHNENVETYFECIEKIQRNIPTSVEVFTLSGYDLTMSDKSFAQSNYIMSESLAALYGNCGQYYLFGMDIQRDEILENMQKQLIANSVKYLIIDNQQDKIDLVTNFLKDMDTVSIKRTVPFMVKCILIELEGIPPICTDNHQNPVSVSSTMDKLQFSVSGNADTYRLAFTYKDGLRADYRSPDGTLRQLSVSEDKDGYLLVHTDSLDNGSVTVTYTNLWIILSNITAVIIITLLLAMCNVQCAMCNVQ